MIKREIHIFFTALMFYTRIPCPKWIDHDAMNLNQATRYFPIIGWIVGGLAGLVVYTTSIILPQNIAILLSIIASILITGGFHEDGFADTCDGFGGGWTKKKILSIMKDSVLGAYGVIGLILILSLKYLILTELYYIVDTLKLCLTIIIGHTVSRTTAIWMIFTDQYVRENEDSKAKPIAKQMGNKSFFIANIFGLSTLALFMDIRLLAIIPCLILVKVYCSYYFKKWIGGYTGDCLGAVQQVAEIIIYISVFLIWRFI